MEHYYQIPFALVNLWPAMLNKLIYDIILAYGPMLTVLDRRHSLLREQLNNDVVSIWNMEWKQIVSKILQIQRLKKTT